MTAKLAPNLQKAAIIAVLAAGPACVLTAEAAEPLKNRFGLSYRAGFNARASFSNLGGVGPASNPGIEARDEDHTYDDGYVLRDSRNAADGNTWNWGYQSASQVPGNDTIQFHSTYSPADGTLKDVSGDPHHGIELSYERCLGLLGRGGSWGLRHTFNFADINIHPSRPTTATLVQTTDTYALMGVVPPEPPYNGSFAGPGTLIDDEPHRSTVNTANGASITGNHLLDASVYGWQLGPYFEFPVNEKVSFNFGGGVALGVVRAKFRFDETMSVSGATIGSAAGSSRKSGFVYGGYTGVGFSYMFEPQWSLTLGVDYQYLTDFKMRASGREAKLDFSSTFYVKGGISFSF
jgi:hypothetical protein